ncbi:hypothetical protein Tco_0217535 [Tanacetum coccineum]
MKQFVISEDESIDSAFARFNTIITSLKLLMKVILVRTTSLETSMTHGDDHPRKIRNIQSKSLNKSLALKQIKESVMKSVLTSGSKDKRDPNLLLEKVQSHRKTITKEPLSRRLLEAIAMKTDDEKVKDETCLVAHASSEICLGVDLEPHEWIKDSGCSKHMTGNRKLFSTYKTYNRDEHVEAEKDDDPKEEEMKKHMEIIQDEEEITIDDIPLATKPPMIVEYKIVKEGQKGFYHLIRADGITTAGRINAVKDEIKDISEKR